jgi:ubiquinone/menaquinone biosynthesis C-methylase UbiE
LTLVDVSSAMIAAARSNVPAELKENVELLNSDLMTAPLEAHSFDLIVCLGVLAHVESPQATLERIATLLRPGGTLMLEFTDAFHPVGRLGMFYHRLRQPFKPSNFSPNLLSQRDVLGMLKTTQLRVISTYRYGMFLPLLHKFCSQKTLYSMVRAVFGTAVKSRNAFLGNAYVCLVKG